MLPKFLAFMEAIATPPTRAGRFIRQCGSGTHCGDRCKRWLHLGHSERVAQIVVLLAEEMACSQNGKIAIIIRQGAGVQWDAKVVEAFFAVRDQIQEVPGKTTVPFAGDLPEGLPRVVAQTVG